MVRLTPTKLLNAFTAVVLLVLLATVFRRQTLRSSGAVHTSTCNVSPEHQLNLHRLVYATHAALDALDLVHFLCYGSLFGQVRRAASLPWERDAELCVLNDEFSKYDEVFLRRAFWKRGLDLIYDSAEGRYVVSVMAAGSSELLELDGCVVQLVVFAGDKDISVSGEPMLHRVGWKRRLLPPDCQYSPALQCFPRRLAETPLPLKLFGVEAVPVPREEFEILKYHFPDDWWREEKPLNC